MLSVRNYRMQKYFFKGQASLEYIVVLLLLLLALIPVIYFGFQDVNAKNSLAQANAAAQQVVFAVDQVRMQGEGSRMVIRVSMPPNVESAGVGNNEIILKVRGPNGALTNVYGIASANMTGSLPNATGIYSINVSMLSNGNVSVKPV